MPSPEGDAGPDESGGVGNDSAEWKSLSEPLSPTSPRHPWRKAVTPFLAVSYIHLPPVPGGVEGRTLARGLLLLLRACRRG